MDKQERVIRLIRTLKALGLKQTCIAKRVFVDSTHISKLLQPDKYPTHTASNNLLLALDKLVITVCLEHMKKILPHWPMYVLDTCNGGLAGINDKVKDEIRNVIQRSFANALDQAPQPISLPAGVNGALVSLAPDLYIIKLDPYIKRSIQLKLMMHELEHLMQRSKAEEPNEGNDNNNSAGKGDFGKII